MAGRTAVSNFQPPKAIGEVRYLDPAHVDAECADFRAVLDEAAGGFVEPFLTAPSPGIVAAAMKNEHYDTEEAYLDGLADALTGRVRGDRRPRLPLAARLPRPRARAPHLLSGPAARASSSASSSGWSRRSTGRSRTCRASACACTSAGATTRGRTTWTCRSPTSCRSSDRRGRRLRVPVRQPPPRPRVSLLRGRRPGRRPDPGRGRDRHADQLRRAPGGRGRADRAGGAGGRRPHAACSPAPTAASTPPPAWAGSPRTWSGPSSRRSPTARG